MLDLIFTRHSLARLLLLFVLCHNMGCATSEKRTPGSAGLVVLEDTARWFVACPTNFSSSLAPLVSHRRAQGWQVVEVPARDENTLLASLQKHNAGSHLGDCLLIVGCHPVSRGTVERMNGVPTDSPLGYAGVGKLPTLAVGRLPARSSGELSIMVKKLLDFEQRPLAGEWRRTATCLVANPVAGAESMPLADWFINRLSKRLLSSVGKGWRTKGAADVRGHPLQVPTEEFPGACEHAISDPYALLAFFGHSNEDVLVSQKQIVLEAADWDNVSASPSRGIFLTCGCYAFRGEGAYGKRAIRAPGGPIACMGSLDESYAAIGYLAGGGLLDGMNGSPPPATVGDWWLVVQEAILQRRMSGVLFSLFDRVDGSNGRVPFATQRLEHAEMWNLLGDPATQMPQ